MGEDHQGSHAREGGGWDPGTLNSVEFVSSVHTSTPAWGEVRAREWRGRPPPQGLLWGQAAAVGAEAQSPAGLPHTVPLCPPTAPVFITRSGGFLSRVGEGGRPACQGSPPGQLRCSRGQPGPLPTPTGAGLSLLARLGLGGCPWT